MKTLPDTRVLKRLNALHAKMGDLRLGSVTREFIRLNFHPDTCTATPMVSSDGASISIRIPFCLSFRIKHTPLRSETVILQQDSVLACPALPVGIGDYVHVIDPLSSDTKGIAQGVCGVVVSISASCSILKVAGDESGFVLDITFDNVDGYAKYLRYQKAGEKGTSTGFFFAGTYNVKRKQAIITGLACAKNNRLEKL